jgi:hypothetical protein
MGTERVYGMVRCVERCTGENRRNQCMEGVVIASYYKQWSSIVRAGTTSGREKAGICIISIDNYSENETVKSGEGEW